MVFKKGHKPWNKDKKGLQVSWNKGKPHTEEHKTHLKENHWSTKGYEAPNKGKTFSQEYRNKLSEAHKGNKLTKEHKIKISKAVSGNSNGRWTGGKAKYNIDYKDWYILRQMILERDGFKCQSCGRTHHETLLDVHHIIPYKISNDNSIENLIVLCRGCHMKQEAITMKKIKEIHGGRFP